MALGFKMRVVGFSPNSLLPPGVEKRTHLQEMLAESDFVSIHYVLNDETRGLIGERELALMRPTSFLVNTARGAIVDEAARLRAQSKVCDSRIEGVEWRRYQGVYP